MLINDTPSFRNDDSSIIISKLNEIINELKLQNYILKTYFDQWKKESIKKS